MDFITLDEALDAMAASIDGDDEVAKYSRVAAELHQKLHNSRRPPPRWVEISKETGLPLLNDAVAGEGMSILMHMAGWKRRKDEERNNHIFACLTSGLDPANVPQSMSVNGGQYNWHRHGFRRETQIGFDRDKWISFLKAADSKQPESKQEPAHEPVKLKRCALVKEVEAFWPTIERDLRDSSRNDLKVAKHTDHGYWLVEKALNWAKERGKLEKSRATQYVGEKKDSALSPMLRKLLGLPDLT